MPNLIPTYANASIAARLNLARSAAPLLAPTVHLFSNDFTPTPRTLVGAFVESAFSGYAAGTPTLGPVVTDDVGNPVSPATNVTFTTDGITPGVAFGYYMLDSAGALLLSGRFPNAPKTFANPGDSAVLTILFGLDSGEVAVAV
jgi:hypothetical protein